MLIGLISEGSPRGGSSLLKRFLLWLLHGK
jgi:hypothetical protein